MYKHYYFVYELRFNNITFYVGMTGFPKFRYQQHIYDCGSIPYTFIRYMIHNFKLYPTMHIIQCTRHRIECRQLEQMQITERIKEGITLFNISNVLLPQVKLNYNLIPKRIFIDLKNDEDKSINEYEQKEQINY